MKGHTWSGRRMAKVHLKNGLILSVPILYSVTGGQNTNSNRNCVDFLHVVVAHTASAQSVSNTESCVPATVSWKLGRFKVWSQKPIERKPSKIKISWGFRKDSSLPQAESKQCIQVTGPGTMTARNGCSGRVRPAGGSHVPLARQRLGSEPPARWYNRVVFQSLKTTCTAVMNGLKSALASCPACNGT
jgi:hypothetical protein